MTTTATAAMNETGITRIVAGDGEERLLTNLFVLYKTTRLVDENNDTFKNQSQTFAKNLRSALIDRDELRIKLISGRFFINEQLVRVRDSGLSGADTVIAEWKKLGVGGVVFDKSASLGSIKELMVTIARNKPTDENADELSEKIKKATFTGINILSAQEIQASSATLTEDVRKQFRRAARTTFFSAMKVVEDIVATTRNEKELNISKTKRVVHSLIEHISRDESSLIELASIKNFDDYTYAHSTNVCVYALTLGVRLELDRGRLSQLGFAALFHDIGKVKLPQDLIAKPDAFDENDWVQMQLHPLLGAKTILRNMKFDMHTARAARVAFEHHINNDFTGYPQLRLEKAPTTLFSKIVAIVDSFDALTSGRVYLKKSIPPDQVLKKMRYQMKQKFDPFLLKIFNDIIGVYPAGSLVLLTSDEIALIITNNDIDQSRPYVKIVGNRDGLLESPEWVDLSQPDQEHRKIIRMIDAERYNLDPKQFVYND